MSAEPTSRELREAALVQRDDSQNQLRAELNAHLREQRRITWEAAREQRVAAEQTVDASPTLDNRHDMAFWRVREMEAHREYLSTFPPEEALAMLSNEKQALTQP